MTPIETILTEQANVFAQALPDAVARLSAAILSAPRVFLYGVGRNGLMLQAFGMRLAHLGRDAHFVGQLAAPPARSRDLLILAAALGSLPTVDAIAEAAQAAGAAVCVITARPDAVKRAEMVVTLKAQTMNDPPTSLLPLGGAFELSLHLLCELTVVSLLGQLGVSHTELRARHANLL